MFIKNRKNNYLFRFSLNNYYCEANLLNYNDFFKRYVGRILLSKRFFVKEIEKLNLFMRKSDNGDF